MSPTWSDQSTKELVELYLTGFTPSMLAEHFQVSIRAIVRRLSAVVLGDEHSTHDPTKAHHHKSWHQDEVLFLASQMQLGRTPTKIAALMDGDVDRFIANGGGGIVGLIWILVTIVPALAVLVRRLHDTGKTGWWALIGFVPLLGGIVLLVITVLDSGAGENKFGESPKVLA